MKSVQDLERYERERKKKKKRRKEHRHYSEEELQAIGQCGFLETEGTPSAHLRHSSRLKYSTLLLSRHSVVNLAVRSRRPQWCKTTFNLIQFHLRKLARAQFGCNTSSVSFKSYLRMFGIEIQALHHWKATKAARAFEQGAKPKDQQDSAFSLFTNVRFLTASRQFYWYK